MARTSPKWGGNVIYSARARKFSFGSRNGVTLLQKWYSAADPTPALLKCWFWARPGQAVAEKPH